ncbi:hypothetical protein [Neobacillus sp. D3-1R]|uniref:hypothetical protein n=1 Tax=Neobacillus sp. D3-1R TaxID=3445778 RepID=UPI003F9EF354
MMNSNKDIAKKDTEQPLMSTGTTEPGFDWDAKDKKIVTEPKIGESLIGEAGILGVFDK